MTRAGILYLASFGAHAAIALGVVSLKGPRTHEDVAVSFVETKKPETREESPPPPPPPPPPPSTPPMAKSAPAKTEAEPPKSEPAESAPPAPDFGLALGNDGALGGGLAVPAPSPAASASTASVTKKVLGTPAPAKRSEDTKDECDEPAKKPKVVSLTQPTYTTAAREAGVAGKVRVEVTVDSAGKVAAVRILEGLGHGLDEAAMDAARGATFEAGTKCGKPRTTTFVIAIRFSL